MPITKRINLWTTFPILCLSCMSLTLCLNGCASAAVYDENGKLIRQVTGYGAFRDIEYTRHEPNGATETLSTKSTTSDIMKAGNEILGTAAGIADKVAP